MNIPNCLPNRSSLKIVVIYAIGSLAYIWGSDWLVLRLIPDPQFLTQVQRYKGSAFVICSTILLFLLIRRAETRQAQVEEKILRERNFSHAVIDSLPGVFYCCDEALTFWRWNDNLARATGRSAAELAGMNPLDCFAVADREQVRRRIQEVFATGKTEFEADLLAKDGTQVACFFTGLAAAIDGRRVALGVGVDYSARKRAEQELRRSQANLAHAQRIAKLGSWELDIPNNRLYWSDQIYEMFGVTPREFEPSYEAFLARVHPEDRERMNAAQHAALSAAAPLDIEHRIILPDGAVKYVHELAALTCDAAGQPMRLTGTVHDITARRRALEELRTSENQFRAIITQAGIGILMVHPTEARILSGNQALADLLGYSLEELAGLTVRAISYDEDYENDREQTKLLIAGRIERFQMEKRYQRKNGSVIWGLLTATVVRNAAGIPQFVLRMVESIHERKQAEARLRLNQQQLRALTARLETSREEERIRISREIHDELGQQLTSLKMDLYGLEQCLPRLVDPSLRSAMEEKIVAASAAADHTMRAVQRIAAELRPAMLDSLGLIPTLRHEAKQFQGRTGLTLALDLPAGAMPLSSAVATAAYRIFQEVLTNIARHARAERVEVSLTTGDGRLQLHVRDNGVGAAAEDLTHPQSLGVLGMKERAAMVGGKLEITGFPGAGTSVLLEIPLMPRSIEPSVENN